jgi:hypothetical protein
MVHCQGLFITPGTTSMGARHHKNSHHPGHLDQREKSPQGNHQGDGAGKIAECLEKEPEFGLVEPRQKPLDISAAIDLPDGILLYRAVDWLLERSGEEG